VGQLEQLNDQSIVEFDDLRLLSEPVQSLGFSFEALPVFLGCDDCGWMFGEFSADADRVKCDFRAGVVFEVFKVSKQRTPCGNAELRFAASMAKRFDELEFCDDGFHGLNLLNRESG
jgi:hypothetical protein